MLHAQTIGPTVVECRWSQVSYNPRMQLLKPMALHADKHLMAHLKFLREMVQLMFA